jgi:hypothetical protein
LEPIGSKLTVGERENHLVQHEVLIVDDAKVTLKKE